MPHKTQYGPKMKKRYPKLVDLLFEKPEEKIRSKKGLDASDNYKKFAADVQKQIPDASVTPGAMKSFLNGAGKDPKVRKLLSFGRGDGSPDDESLDVKEVSAPVKGLLPTQKEIELGKSVGWPLAHFGTMKKIIAGKDLKLGKPGSEQIIINGDLIIDGHHRWSQAYAINPAATISSYDLGLPTSKASASLALTQFAIGSTLTKGEEVPSATAGGFNILNTSKDKIFDAIIDHIDETIEKRAGPILGENVVKKFIQDSKVAEHFGLSSDMSVEDARQKIATKVANNLASLPSAATGSPPREDMPQLDQAKGGVKGVINNLEKGAVNFIEPLLPGQKKESIQKKRADVILERWRTLAGILEG